MIPGQGYGCGEALGAAEGETVVAGGEATPAAGVAGCAIPGDGETLPALAAGALPGEPVAGAGDEAGAAVGIAISSRRKLLSLELRCAYRTPRIKVRTKKIPASQPVNFVSTLVVCAPKIFSVTPPPKAAPRPSLFGRCIRMTSAINTATSMSMARRTLIRMFIASGQYRQVAPLVNALHAALSSEPRSVARRT